MPFCDAIGRAVRKGDTLYEDASTNALVARVVEGNSTCVIIAIIGIPGFMTLTQAEFLSSTWRKNSLVPNIHRHI